MLPLPMQVLNGNLSPLGLKIERDKSNQQGARRRRALRRVSAALVGRCYSAMEEKQHVKIPIIGGILLVISIILNFDGALFYGINIGWRVIMEVAMFSGPILIIKRIKPGAYLAALAGLYFAFGGLSLLDGSSLAEIEAITKAKQPSDFSIYLTGGLGLFYFLLSGICILEFKKQKETTEELLEEPNEKSQHT